jgi:hypothetical protein
LRLAREISTFRPELPGDRCAADHYADFSAAIDLTADEANYKK